MAYSAEIRDSNRKYLTSLMMTQILGGDLDDAITSQRASMEPEDVLIVTKEFEAHLKKKQSQ
jgi:hypothetical protein